MLAIIIPYFKISFFDNCLQSLADQTDKRFKVYIGDDASPENPSQIIAKYTDQLELVYQRFETNLGGTSLVKQWERCIDLSGEEEWIMILGDDDVLSSNCIEQFYSTLEEVNKENCNLVRFSTVIIDEKSKITSTIYSHPKFEKATDFFYRRFTNKTRSSLSEYIFKRKSYEKFGFYHYDLAWFTDDRAWLEFPEFNMIYSINKAIVSFRLSNESISRDNYKIVEKETVKLQFFNFIVMQHLKNFTPSQQDHLLKFYEQLVYKNKRVSFNFYFFLFLKYLQKMRLLNAIKFTRRLIIHLSNNDK